MVEPVIALDGLYKTYSGGVPVHALKPTTLRINAGDYTAITGPSGSGKSTLLNMLGLLDRPSGGDYHYAGRPVSTAGEDERLSLRGREFGFVFQAFHLLAGRTALENVELGQLYVEPDRRLRRARATEILERFNLGHRLHSQPHRLSGGEKQRVAIARALSGSPKVLFCDEPTGNLDSMNAEVVLSALSELNAGGLTIVIVTHDESVAAAAGRQLGVHDGEVVRHR